MSNLITKESELLSPEEIKTRFTEYAKLYARVKRNGSGEAAAKRGRKNLRKSYAIIKTI